MDGQFECIRAHLHGAQITLDVCAANDHVKEVERMIRTVKERVRGVQATVPFKKMPGRMVIELVYASVFWLNCFYPSKSICGDLSPRTIITGQTIDFNRHIKHEFGDYVQTHEATDNTMRERTVGAVALRPTGNEQGSYFYLSLSTGKKLNRLRATELPMPQDVIDRVHFLAKKKPQA